MADNQSVVTVAPFVLNNPYWEEAQAAGFNRWGLDTFSKRRPLVEKYSWALADDETAAFVAFYLGAMAVEMGAGTGYWSFLMAQFGVDILAYDIAPTNVTENAYHGTVAPWFDVKQGNTRLLRTMAPERSLLLCWPPYDTDMGAAALRAFQGTRVVYIGEGYGGCTGNDAFHKALERHWTLIARHDGPSWDGIHDSVYVYDRAAPALPAAK